MFFGLHGAACAMHVAAVDKLWADFPQERDRFVWSHGYCEVVSAPIRMMFKP